MTPCQTCEEDRSLNRGVNKRWSIGLAVLAVLLIGVSGCAGGAVRATSWTGLTVVEDELYVADLQQVAVLNGEDASIAWTFPGSEEEEGSGIWLSQGELTDSTRGAVFYVAPAVSEGRVIVASQAPSTNLLGQPQNIVWGLNPETGRWWHFDEAQGQYIEGGAISGSIFVIGNSDNNIYALDVESGLLKWVFETGHRVWATPLIISDTVYIGSMDHNLYALALDSGRVQWQFQADGAFAGTPALWDGTLYIGAFDDRFYAIDAETGIERWRFEGQNWFWGGPAVYEGIIYAADVDGNVYALEAETGAEIWRQAIGSPVRAGLEVAEDGSQVFVGSQDGALRALDASDGFVMWTRESEGEIYSKPVVDGDMLYEMLLFSPHRLRALHVENGRDVWVYPPVVEEE